MSIPDFFMQIARDKLPKDVFDDLQARAVAAERRRVEAIPTLPAALQVNKPGSAARVAAHLNNTPDPKVVPHVAQRIEERLEIKIGPSDLGELARIVRNGGPNVTITKQVMEMVQHCTVHWRGKTFTVLFSRSRDAMITAYPYRKLKPQHRPVARKAVRERHGLSTRDIDDEDEKEEGEGPGDV